jgi:rubrerythrin
MAKGICYVCNQMFSGKDKDTAVEKMVEHMMAEHHGWIWGDAMQTKNTFEKCPVCGAALGKLYANCPSCGADLIEQYAIQKANAYVH